MKNDGRFPFRVAARFPIQPIAVTDIQLAAIIGINAGVEGHAKWGFFQAEKAQVKYRLELPLVTGYLALST